MLILFGEKIFMINCSIHKISMHRWKQRINYLLEVVLQFWLTLFTVGANSALLSTRDTWMISRRRLIWSRSTSSAVMSLSSSEKVKACSLELLVKDRVHVWWVWWLQPARPCILTTNDPPPRSVWPARWRSPPSHLAPSASSTSTSNQPFFSSRSSPNS
jgi:hypothetical protein